MVIHHTLSFTVVINIVMGWTFTMKLPGEQECKSLLGEGGRGGGGGVRLLQPRVNRRKIMCACHQTLSPEMLLARPRSAINLPLRLPAAPGLHNSLYLHTRPLFTKTRDVILSLSLPRLGFNHRRPILRRLQASTATLLRMKNNQATREGRE